jgi:hypothetical protein
MQTLLRTRVRRALAAAAAGAALLTGPAWAATGGDTVTAADFPGVGQVAAIDPDYTGGNRTIEADHPVWIFRTNCSSYEDGPSGQIRKWAYYEAPDGTEADSWVRFHVQQFATVADAKRAIRTIRSNSEGCYGTHHIEATDATLIRRAADVPSLGAGRPVAWKMNDHWTEQRDGLERSYYSRRIWMREGETVIGLDLWGEVAQPRRASIRLARLALRTVD